VLSDGAAGLLAGRDAGASYGPMGRKSGQMADFRRQPRNTSGRIAVVDDSLGGSLGQSDGRRAELRRGGFFVAGGNGLIDLSYQATNGGFRRASADAPL
jgi:hypothetical protein